MADPVKFFSVLGALAKAAPQSMTGEQWSRYLQPGRTLTRGGVRFPLRKDELLYGAGPGMLDRLGRYAEKQTFSPEYMGSLHGALEEELNPRFLRKRETPLSAADAEAGGMMHHPNQYQLPGPKLGQAEHLTLLPGSDFAAGSHFGSRPGLLSWNRTTTRPVVGGGLLNDTREETHNSAWTAWQVNPTSENRDALERATKARSGSPTYDKYLGQRMTLLEEAQSDWHQKARKKGYNPGPLTDDNFNELQDFLHRQGHLTPEDLRRQEYLYARMHGAGVPNAPYSDTWHELELRKALADAVTQDHDYLGVTTGQQQVDRYPGLNPQQRAGMLTAYDRDMPAALRRLSLQYGGPEVGTSQVPNTQGLMGKNDPRWSSWRALHADPRTISEDELESHIERLFPGASAGLHEDPSNNLEDALMNLHIGHTITRDAHDDWRRTNSLQSHADYVDSAGMYQGAVKDLEPFLSSAQPPQSVHSLQLAPELRDRIRSAGLPLFARGGLVEEHDMLPRFASGGTTTYPPLSISVHSDPDPSSLYGFGPSFRFIEYGSDQPPATVPPPAPAPTPGSGGGTTPPATGSTAAPVGGTSNAGAGNAGNSGSAGAAGDYAGHPGLDATGRNTVDVSRLLAGQDPGDPGYFTVPRWADNLYRGIEAIAPWQISLPMAAAHEAAQLYNTSVTDQARTTQGIPSLDTGQWLGSAAGFNPYGDLHNPLVANTGQFMGALAGAVDPRTGESLYGAPTKDYAETLTGEPANYGPFGVFGTSGPNNLSYRQANLVTNPGLAPRQVTATGQNYATSLGLPLSPTSRAANSLAYGPGGALASYMGTPISAGGIDPSTGQTQYTPAEAANRAAAVHAPSVGPAAAPKRGGGPTVNGVAVASWGQNGTANLADGTIADANGQIIGRQTTAGQGAAGYGGGGGYVSPSAGTSYGDTTEASGGYRSTAAVGAGGQLGGIKRGGLVRFARGGPTGSDYVGHPGRSELAPRMDELEQAGLQQDLYRRPLRQPYFQDLGPLDSPRSQAPALDLGAGDYHELPPLPPGPEHLDLSQVTPPLAGGAPPPVAAAPPPQAAPAVTTDDYKRQVAALESNNDPNAANPNSSARGLYQLTRDTWEGLRARHPELGLKSFDSGAWKDVGQQNVATDQLTADNTARLKAGYMVDAQDAVSLYSAHLLGADGGGRFLTAVTRDPTAPVTRYVAPAAALANRGVFYGPAGPLTVKQAYDRIQRSLAAGSWQKAA